MRDATLNIATGELIEHTPVIVDARDWADAQRALLLQPVLLAALRYSVKQMAAFIGDRGIDHPMYVALIEARAAIAKATGEQS